MSEAQREKWEMRQQLFPLNMPALVVEVMTSPAHVFPSSQLTC